MGEFKRPAVEELVLVKLWVVTGGRLLDLAVEKSGVAEDAHLSRFSEKYIF